MSDGRHIRAFVRRHTSPGALMLAALAVLFFGPRLLDVAQDVPRLENELTVVLSTTGQPVVQDLLRVNDRVSGARTRFARSADGHILCSHEVSNTWAGEMRRNWRVSAFAGCQPTEPFEVCATFDVSSGSGRRKQFGEFCSARFYPEAAE